MKYAIRYRSSKVAGALAGAPRRRQGIWLRRAAVLVGAAVRRQVARRPPGPVTPQRATDGGRFNPWLVSRDSCPPEYRWELEFRSYARGAIPEDLCSRGTPLPQWSKVVGCRLLRM